MKKVFNLGLVLTVALAVSGTACTQGENVNTSSSMNKNMMNGMANHNAMVMDANSAMPDANHGMSDMMSRMKSDPNAASAPYDLQFIDTMIAHHEGAVEMAKMIDGKTQRSELKGFAQKIIADQNKEIAHMNEWREKWYAGKQRAINMEMPGMGDSMKMDMNKLTNAKDKEFDLAFVEMMIPHHAGATTMAKEALTKADHQELKTLAGNIIKEQEAEITQMKVWQSEWAK